MSAAAFNRNMAPIGYLDLRPAMETVWCRMFTSDIPAGLIDAARANVALARRVRANPAEAADLTPDKIFEISERSRIPAYRKPVELIADALRSGRLTLFMYPEDRHRVVPVPAICTHEVLDRAGLFRNTRETIILRWMDFLPRRILDGLDLPDISKAQFDKFALCLRESAFDNWLASTARQHSWPLDAEPRRGRGRPKLISIVKPILKGLIHSSRWRQGMPLKVLVVLIQSKIKGEKVDRETVKKAMDELYHETGQPEYRYVRRKRRPLTTPRAR